MFELTLLEKILGSFVIVFAAILAYGKSIFRTKKECVDMLASCEGKHEKRDYIKRPEYTSDQEQQNTALFNLITSLTNEIGGMRKDLREIERSRRQAEEKWVEFIRQHTEFVATIHLRVKNLEEWKVRRAQADEQFDRVRENTKEMKETDIQGE